MKNNLWRFLAKSLCVCCVLAAAFTLQFTLTEKTDAQPLLLTKAEAATYSGKCGENVSWSLNTSTGVLNITGSGDTYKYDYYDDLPWYQYLNDIKTVNIADGVTSIGEYAFYKCSSLTSITIPSSVTSIGDYAFYKCSSLTSITIPSSVTSIGGYAFYNCSSLKSVTIGNGVTSIGGYAFYNCSSLTSITIPSSVTSIGGWAFEDCSSLTSIKIPDSVTSIGSGAFTNTAYYNTGKNWKNNVLYIGKHLIDAKASLSGSYKITNGTITIAGGAFDWCSSLTSITIPSSVTSIGDSAFEECSSLTSITIPNSVTSIGNRAFKDCSSLTSIKIPDSVTSIGYYAFTNTAYYNTEKNWKNNVLYIGKHLIEAKYSLSGSYKITNGTITIADYAFLSCSSLTSITIPNSVTSIGDGAFEWCRSLTSITIPSSVTNIGNYAFNCCSSLTSITIPDSVTSIGDEVFLSCPSLENFIVNKNNSYYSSLDGVLFNKDRTELIQYPAGNTKTNYSIPDGVKSIGEYAFSACRNLTSITIPSSVKSIGEYAFSACRNLTSITIPSSVTSIGDGAFEWCSSLTSITIPSSVTSIGDDAFFCCDSLTSITIPSSVTSIGVWAFKDCSSLTSIKIPDSVTSIESSAFENTGYYNTEKNWKNNVLYIGKHLIEAKDSLSGSYKITNGTITIADYAFWSCSSLTSITIPSSVTSIGEWAFSDCSSLTSITIPNSVTSIGELAFSDCSSLTSITIPSSVTSIGDEAFRDCSSLKSIEIPDSMTSINFDAFYNCSGLESIVIPDSVTSIVYGAFSGCKSLSDVYYTGTQKKWNAISIGQANGPLLNAKIHFNYIKSIDISTCDVKLSATSFTYNGKERNPYFIITNANGTKLTKNTDYTVTYESGRKNVGTYDVTVKMKGNYTGTKTLSFKINPANISTCDVKLSATSFTYNGNVRSPYFIIKTAGGTTLKKDTDYTVTYASGRKNVGTYKVTVKMIGNYSGTKTLSFKIVPQATSKITVSKTTSSIKATWNKVSGVTGYKVFLYKGSTLVRSKVVSSNVTSYTFSELISGTAYTVKVQAYKALNNTNYWSAVKSYTTATLPKTTSKITVTQTTVSIKATWSKVSGVSGYKVSIYKGSTLIKSKTLSSSSLSCTFTGLVSGTKYTVKVQAYKNLNNTTYYSAVKSISTATKTATTSITSLKAGTKSATVKWKNVSGESGYQVYYATSKNGTYKLGATLKANDIDTTIKSLTTGKTYYFKVRAYTKTDSGTVYSAFSSVKSVKVK